MNRLPWENKDLLSLFIWASVQKDIDSVVLNPKKEPNDTYVLWAYLALKDRKFHIDDEFFGHEKTEEVNKLINSGMLEKEAILKCWNIIG